jgi:NTE family protein
MQSLAEAIPLLKEAGPQAVAQVASVGEWFSLPGGWPLFHIDEPADALHFVLAGALVVVRPGMDGADEIIGYVRAGEPVGEMALIGGGGHTASVYALRDSELLRIPRADYDRIWRAHPMLLESLARRMLLRARQPRPDMRTSAPRVFTLIAASPSIAIESIARDLRGRINGLGLNCAAVFEESFDQPTSYFENLERTNDILLLAARLQPTPWCRLALRQADRIWLFARRDAKPPRPLPLIPDENTAAQRFRLIDLVFLEEGSQAAAEPKDWIDAVGASRFFRWRSEGDAQRLARTITGKSVGLVLAGGGARAYAHVGVMAALDEARVPVDFIGGTSMGAIIAAGIALGWSNAELDMRVRRGFVDSNPLSDYRLPVVSMTVGRVVERRLAEHFGDARIEDMRLPFFCVATDLAGGTQHIFRTGLIRQALRASIALPGILPPVVAGGQVLVDGAVLNNLPTDIMGLMHRGLTIGVDVAQQEVIHAADFENPPNFLGWVLRHGLKSPPPIVSLLIRTATIGIDPAAGRKGCDILIVPKLANVEIRDWKAYDAAVHAGYEATVRMLAEDGHKLPRGG